MLQLSEAVGMGIWRRALSRIAHGKVLHALYSCTVGGKIRASAEFIHMIGGGER